MNEYNIHIKHIYVYLCNLLQSVWFYWNHFNVYIYEATVCQERSTPEIAEPEQPEAYSLECVYTGAETEGMLQSIYIYTCIYDVFLKYFIDFWFSVYQYIYNYIYTYIFRDQQHTHIHKTLKKCIWVFFPQYIYIYFEIKIYTTSIKRWFVIYT